MYISIDKKTSRFVHKHPSVHVVTDLDFLIGIMPDVEPVEPHTLRVCVGWSDADMQKLYKRTTGQETCPYVGDSLRTILAELACRVPQSVCSIEHVRAQATWLENKSPAGGGYFYNHGAGAGAWMPLPQSPRWEPPALVCPLTAEEGTQAVRARVTAAQQHTASLPPPTPIPPRSAAPSAPREPRASGSPRSGVCAAIWAALDSERVAQGGEVPSRDRVKELAQANRWNSSTASVQFAAWRKHNNLS